MGSASPKDYDYIFSGYVNGVPGNTHINTCSEARLGCQVCLGEDGALRFNSSLAETDTGSRSKALLGLAVEKTVGGSDSGYTYKNRAWDFL